MNRVERAAKAVRARLKRLENSDLTLEELAQVERIVGSRRVRSSANRPDAIDLVLRYRMIGQMVCHGGTEETI